MFKLVQKHPFQTLLALLILVLMIWGFWPQPVIIEAIRAQRAAMTVSIEEEGRTRVINRYLISAPVNGVTCRQQLKVGDAIEQGQTLLTISALESQVLDPRSRAQAQARVAASEAALSAAEELAKAAHVAAQLATNELERLTPLMQQDLIARDTFERAASAAQTASATQRSSEFRVETARYELEAARMVLDYAQTSRAEPIPVRAPISGRVLKLARQCEGPVSTGESLLEVGDPSELEVEVDVLSSDAVKISPGMRVQFDRWGGAQTLRGVVRIVEPAGFSKTSALGVEEQRVLVISDFTSPPELWQRLGDGYRVEAKFILWQQDQVLQVPTSSVFRFNGGHALFLVENNRALRRLVKIGQQNGLVTQIIEGLSEGETVINHPSDEVDNGARVKIQNIDDAGAV